MVTRYRGAKVPERAGGYPRISDDPLDQQVGVKRQTEDIQGVADREGIKGVTFYTENDTSAHKKRRVTLPDGSVGLRVIRPKFRKMLEDLQAGVIDSIIIYDLDRLLRQPRDLEDLIDIVEMTGAQVYSVSGRIDLRTSDGRAMARVLTAMAAKSSDDTARRVARAKLQDARDGVVRRIRRFGWTPEGEIIPEEAKVLRDAAELIIGGEPWSAVLRSVEAGDVRPPGGKRWHLNTLRNMLVNPMIAGISAYRGTLRESEDAAHGSKSPTAADPAADAMKNPDGSYVMTDLPPILSVEQWEAICKRITDAHEGKTPESATSKKYLLSGFLRCARIGEDGKPCHRKMIGTRIKDRFGKYLTVYKCPGTVHGGCGRCQRLAGPVDQLIERLFTEYLTAAAPLVADAAAHVRAEALQSPEAQELNDAKERLEEFDQNYVAGTVTRERYFKMLPALEARIKHLTAKVTAEADRRSQLAPLRTPTGVIREWQKAETIAAKRAILGQYLLAVEIGPSATRGRQGLDRASIVPVWREFLGE